MAPEPYSTDFGPQSPAFWLRMLHFEGRYWSIDQLMTGLPAPPTNIIEVSSGFSFRGLALSRERPVYYVDTDLPDVIATKRAFVDVLGTDATSTGGSTPDASPGAASSETPGHYELQALNALDKTAFEIIADRFPPGPLTIVNEGLLVYLDLAEKQRLCRIIRDILLVRGGCWITGDIYIRRSLEDPLYARKDSLQQFFDQHHVEENKFGSFGEAHDFFADNGLVLEAEAQRDNEKLTTFPYLMASLTPEQLSKLREAPRIHASWRLRAIS
jgi:hypothetical protein